MSKVDASIAASRNCARSTGPCRRGLRCREDRGR